MNKKINTRGNVLFQYFSYITNLFSTNYIFQTATKCASLISRAYCLFTNNKNTSCTRFRATITERWASLMNIHWIDVIFLCLYVFFFQSNKRHSCVQNMIKNRNSVQGDFFHQYYRYLQVWITQNFINKSINENGNFDGIFLDII